MTKTITCECGGTYRRGGPVTSHQRACTPHREAALARAEEAVAAIESGQWGADLGDATREHFRQRAIKERDACRRQLGIPAAT